MADFAYRIAFVLMLAIPVIGLSVIVWKRWLKFGAILLVIYAAIYAALSMAGHYSVANRGGNDWRREWCPAGLIQEYTSPAGRTKTDFTLAGATFWPCILVDHIFWHRTTIVVE